ncbi:hypothetical protein B0O99DRAFT_695475 [Bisporella sp. PMI_857]|nr:hypothetical protein B0O99DRAFT_695475 [Bisporella sp. PMI_857]
MAKPYRLDRSQQHQQLPCSPSSSSVPNESRPTTPGILTPDHYDYTLSSLVNAERAISGYPVNFDRGPYKNDLEYLRSMTTFVPESMQKHASGQKHQDLKINDMIMFAVQTSKRLMEVLPLDPFSSLNVTDKHFVLDHYDLRAANILVDRTTLKITAVLDWENVSIVPRWDTDEFPSILYNIERSKEPDLSADFCKKWPLSEKLERLDEYHCTCIRRQLANASTALSARDKLMRRYMFWRNQTSWGDEAVERITSSVENFKNNGIFSPD